MKYTPEYLLQELGSGRSYRDAHLSTYADMVRRYHQADYKGFDECDFAPENSEGEYLSLMIAKIAFTEPRVRVRYRSGSKPGALEAKALKFALNQWSADVCLGETLQEVARDYLFNFGAIYTSVDPVPGYGATYAPPTRAHWPQCHRLSQRQFVLDPLCGIFKYARWAGHEYTVEQEALLELATNRPELGWDAAAIAALQTTTDVDWRPDIEDAPDREELRVARIWVPGYFEPGNPGPEDGFNGTIFTLVHGQDINNIDGWVRKPFSYYGPRWGPYALAGAYAVPDSPWPLGPLTMTKGRTDELNAHAVAASKSMAEYKRLVLVDASHPDLVQMLKRPDQFVIPIKGLNPQNVIQIEMGGMTDQQLTALATLRERVDRSLAMSEAKRGRVAGGTATENAIADESSQVRVAYLKQRFSAAVTQVYRTVGHYMLMDDRIVMDLDDEAAQELGMVEPVFVGGAGADPGSGIDPDMMQFTIEPYSMDYVGQGVAKQQFIEGLNLALQMAPAIPQMPYVKWKDLFTKMGDALNDEDWGDMIEADVAAMMGGMPGALPASPTPMMASMAGAPGGMGAPAMGPGSPGLAAPGGTGRPPAGPAQASGPGMTMGAASKGGRMAGAAAGGGRGLR